MAWNYELFIDGKWTSEEAVGTIDVIDPATEEVIGQVPEASTKTAVRRDRPPRADQRGSGSDGGHRRDCKGTQGPGA